MTGKVIISFLWGVIEASLIWGTCVFPLTDNSWAQVFPLGLTFSTIGLLAVSVVWIVDHWNE